MILECAEENYYRYYGWPTYWEGGRVWGASEYPDMTPATPPESMGVYEYDQWDDIHLRSTKAVHGYAIEASDGTIGAVSGFVVDDKSWIIRDVVVDAGHWYSGKEILVPSCKVKRVSYAETKVYVNLSMADIKQTAENEVAQPAA